MDALLGDIVRDGINITARPLLVKIYLPILKLKVVKPVNRSLTRTGLMLYFFRHSTSNGGWDLELTGFKSLLFNTEEIRKLTYCLLWDWYVLVTTELESIWFICNVACFFALMPDRLDISFEWEKPPLYYRQKLDTRSTLLISW